MPDAYLRITVELYRGAGGEDDLKYRNTRHEPLVWFDNERYDGYLTYEFQEMLAELRRAIAPGGIYE